MATQNINNFNFNRFDIKLDNSEYFDLTLASDEKSYDEEVVFSNYLIAETDGNRLPINIDLNSAASNPKDYLYWGNFNSGNTATSKNYYNPNNEDLSCYVGYKELCDVGLTMIDTGMYPYMTGQTLYYTMGIDEFMTYNPHYYDRRFKMRQVYDYTNPPNFRFSGNPKETIYNIMSKEDSQVGYYQELYGGFFQGFYKLHGYDYEVFPERVNKGWTMETVIKPRQVDEYHIREQHQTYLNTVYPENAGTFFFFGTRAENKFYHPASGLTQTPENFKCDFDFDTSGGTQWEYQRVTSGLTNCIKTCGCADTANTESHCLLVYPQSGTTVKHNIGPCCSYNTEVPEPPVDPAMDVFSNAMSIRLSGDPKNPRLCVKYIKLTGDCVTTGTCETTGLTYCSGYTINEICSSRGIYDVCGYPVSEAERTKERWVMLTAVFDRYQWYDGCDLLNKGGLGDIREHVYSSSTYGATVNLIQPPQTHEGGKKELPEDVIELNRKWLRQVNDRRGVLRLYVNGYLFMVIEDFEEIIPRELNTQREKQIGVPFNISWGGGTQGLRESLIFQNCEDRYGPYIQDPELMPNNTLSGTSLSGLTTDILMEQNFGGTFMGGISQFRMYVEPLDSSQIQHNFRVLKDRFNLFDYWCPNCLEILSQCYFDFNVDTVTCRFDYAINDIECDFGFNIIDANCDFNFNVTDENCEVDVNVILYPTQTQTPTLTMTPTLTATMTPTLSFTPQPTNDVTSTPLVPTQTPPVPTPTYTPPVPTPTLSQQVYYNYEVGTLKSCCIDGWEEPIEIISSLTTLNLGDIVTIEHDGFVQCFEIITLPTPAIGPPLGLTVINVYETCVECTSENECVYGYGDMTALSCCDDGDALLDAINSTSILNVGDIIQYEGKCYYITVLFGPIGPISPGSNVLYIDSPVYTDCADCINDNPCL